METANSVQARVSTELEAPMPTKPQAPVSTEQGAACPMCHSSGSLQSWLAKRRGWVLLGGAAVAGTGLALGEGWVTVAGLAPLLYAAPCAVMMIFCMKGMSRGMQTPQDQASSMVPPTTHNDATRITPELEKQT